MAAAPKAPMHPPSVPMAIQQSLSSLALAAVEVIVKPRVRADGLVDVLEGPKLDIRNAAWLCGKILGNEGCAKQAEEEAIRIVKIKELIGNVHPNPQHLLEKSIEKIKIAATRAIRLSHELHRAKQVEDKALKKMLDILMGAGDAKTRARRALAVWNSDPATILQNTAEALKDAANPESNPAHLHDRIASIPQMEDSPEIPVNKHLVRRTIQAITEAVAFLTAHCVARQKIESDAQNIPIYDSIQKHVVERARKATLEFLEVVPPQLATVESTTKMHELLKSETLESSISALCLAKEWQELANLGKHPKAIAMQEAATAVLNEARTQARRAFFHLDDIVTQQIKIMEILGRNALNFNDEVGDHLIKAASLLQTVTRIFFLEVDGIDGNDISDDVKDIILARRNALFKKALEVRSKQILRSHDADLANFIEAAVNATEAANRLYDRLRSRWHQTDLFLND